MSIGDATRLNRALDPFALGPDPNGNFWITCTILSGTTNLEFVIGGTAFSISHQDFVGPEATIGTDVCTSYIVGRSNSSDSSWSFGTGFLRNVASPVRLI
jgi:Eukaryotic aspartyl protease